MKALTLLLFLAIGKISFAQTCANVPSQNKRIIAYVKTKVGKNIGETDLIYASYKFAGIKYKESWLGNDIYPSENDCVFPGDIISFTRCNVDWKIKDTTVTMSYGCPVEYIIYKVKPKGVYQVIVQQEDEAGKVTATLLDYSDKNFINGDHPRFYRPFAK